MIDQSPEVYQAGQITADWLERTLAAAGHADAGVVGFSTRAVGTGQAAGCFRILPEYRDPRPDLPRSIITKFPSDDEGSANAAANSGTYLREIQFYRTLRAQLTIRTPRSYLAECNASGARFALLLEDLAPADQGDQIAGCDAEMARLSVLELVGLHAPTWDNPAILDLDFVRYTSLPERAANIMQRIYRAGLPAFVDRCAQALEPEELALLRRAADCDELPSEYPRLATRCLAHNDYRLDNFLFVPENPAETLRVVDWQTYGSGNPMRDVSYFIGGCLLPELRRRIEQDLVREYHDAMCASGVKDYTFAQCWSDYRQAAWHGTMYAMAGMAFVRQTERGDRLFATMAQRHARQILELGADEFLR
ncbi:phosphotransferase [Novosphingobium bradum]|uniref:Phosphotransferase n=1 Tax=Novosphingobium bradum TaxID=1737444 RepID=A0ABV7INB5_9SPHN